MKRIDQIVIFILNIIVPVILFYMIIFYLFFAHGSGNGSEVYIQNYGIYWTLGYILIGVLHTFLIYRFSKMVKNLKYILAILIFIIYIAIAYSNMDLG